MLRFSGICISACHRHNGRCLLAWFHKQRASHDEMDFLGQEKELISDPEWPNSLRGEIPTEGRGLKNVQGLGFVERIKLRPWK